MTYNEAETRFHLIDPVLRDKSYDDHQRIRLETPAPVEIIKSIETQGSLKTCYRVLDF